MKAPKKQQSPTGCPIRVLWGNEAVFGAGRPENAPFPYFYTILYALGCGRTPGRLEEAEA